MLSAVALSPASHSHSRIGPASGSTWLEETRRGEPSLPELIEIAETVSTDGGLRSLRLRIHPGPGGRARLVFDEGVTLQGAGAREGAKDPQTGLELQRGAPPLERWIEFKAPGAGKAPVRVGLIFENERGEVTLTYHREIPARGVPAADRPETPHKLVTDSRGETVVTYFPSAPKPIVGGIGP